ncbi:MAG: GTPase Era [Anaerolineae bacterium]|nr:GTPase Era [Anaerolineae bacterium]
MEEEFELYSEYETLDEEQLPEGHKSGFVALVGRPNVGKSTLLNNLLQQKVAIVSPRPQTTRTRQLGILTRPDYQMIFVDTPGIMQPRHKLDEFMLDEAIQTLEEVDVVLWLVDAGEPPGPSDLEFAKRLKLLAGKTPVILGMNKVDTLEAGEVMPRSEAYQALLPDSPWILFSATENLGTEELFAMLLDALPEGPRFYPSEQVTDIYERDLAAELIREQILLQIREEIPHGTAVAVDEFKERETGMVYIHAIIYVERETHKKIVIGSRGAQLRAIGAAARQEIERMLGTRVYLELWVKVEPQWRRNEHALKRLGYSSAG